MQTEAIAGTVELGLRERKAAATRLAIVASLQERLATTPLSDISVEDLTADANVSRMTFFNYFPAKDHAVDFLMVVWLYELEASVAEKRARGVAAIEHVFARLGDEMAEAPERMRRVFGYFATRPGDRPMPELTAADRAAIAPEMVGRPIGLTALGGMFMRMIEEAHEDGEIELVGSSYEMGHFLGALLNGAQMVGHSTPDTDWPRLFRRHARRALGLLGKGGRDPRAPRIPARYRARGKR